MKGVILLSFLSTLTLGLPTGGYVEKRQLAELLGLGGVKCGKVAVLFSRGTFEFGANGMTVGPQFTTALQTMLPYDTQFWGNDYDNNAINYMIGGSSTGAKVMKDKAEEYVSKCPDIKLVMSGYSQGAQVTHKALDMASSAVHEATKAVVLFGDPMSGRRINGIPSDKIKTVCSAGDTICWGLPLITASHMTYSLDSMSSAAWVKSKLGL